MVSLFQAKNFFINDIAGFQTLRSGLRLSQVAPQQRPPHSTLARPLMHCHVTRMANMTQLEQRAYFPGTIVVLRSGSPGAQTSVATSIGVPPRSTVMAHTESGATARAAAFQQQQPLPQQQDLLAAAPTQDQIHPISMDHFQSGNVMEGKSMFA